jgi:sugar phosphate isomerase/epimerase
MTAPGPLALNTATTRGKWGLLEAIDGCVRHGISGISPWRDQLADCGVPRAAAAIRERGLTVTSLCRGGLFTGADAEARAIALDDNRRAVDEAAAIGAQCLVLVVGGLPPGSKDIADARRQVEDSLGRLLDYARAAHMPLALEPLHPMYAADRACVNTLGQANDLCESLGEGIGVAVDVYHVWWDPALYAEIARAAGRILGFHVCDWLVPTRDLLLDRGMMGDGVIDIPAIRTAVQATGYDGFCDVEVISSAWWEHDPDEVLATCLERHRTAV